MVVQDFTAMQRSGDDAHQRLDEAGIGIGFPNTGLNLLSQFLPSKKKSS